MNGGKVMLKNATLGGIFSREKIRIKLIIAEYVWKKRARSERIRKR